MLKSIIAHQNILALTFNIITTVVSGMFLLWSFYRTWKFKKEFADYQNRLQKDFENHKQVLQAELIRTDIKIKQLSIVYPDIFLQYKLAESSISALYRKKKEGNEISRDELINTNKTIEEAIGNMVRNLLFVSSEVEGISDEITLAFSGLKGTINLPYTDETKKFMANIRALIDKLQLQMKKELDVR